MKNTSTTLLILLPLAVWISHAQAREWRVGVGTGYSLSDVQHQLKSQIMPGDVVLIASGTYGADQTLGNNSLAVNEFQGELHHPIVFKGASEISKPRLTEGVSVHRSRHVIVQNLDVVRTSRDMNAAAVAVSESAYVQLSSLSVHDSHVGVSFLDSAPGNSIRYSHIVRNDHHGVTSSVSADKKAVNKSHDEASTSSIEFNLIEDNGAHGIDMEAPYWRIQRNRILNNGSAYGGTSGVHLFSEKDRGDDDPDCDNNQVIYNYISGQKDDSFADGNGIQIDHFCDNNIVAYNVVTKNAGAGISLFAGKSNGIFSNTLYHNATDTNRKSLNAYRGEIILASEASICPNGVIGICLLPQVRIKSERSGSNVIFDNIVVSGQSDVPGIHVTDDFKNPARHTNYLYVNWFGNEINATPLQWGSESTGEIDSKTVEGNILAPVSFANTEFEGPEGFRLTALPPHDNLGWSPPQRWGDMDGKFPLPPGQGKTSNWGAYYLCSGGPCPSQ